MEKHYIKLKTQNFENNIKISDLKTAIKLSLPKWRGDDLLLHEDIDKESYYVHLCGSITDKTSLDFDSKEIFYRFKKEVEKQGITLDDTPVIETGKGFQVFYKYIKGLKTSVSSDKKLPIDVRNDGALSFAHKSLFKYGYYKPYNNIDMESRREITPAELDVFLNISDTSLDIKEIAPKHNKDYKTYVKTSKYFEDLVKHSIEKNIIDGDALLKEVQSTRPFEFERIPTQEGEGRNNFLTILKGKILRHININAEEGAKFLELVNDTFLNLPKKEMKNFNEKALLKNPLYIDPEDYLKTISTTYNFDKKFYGQAVFNDTSHTWCMVEIRSVTEVKVEFFANKENFVSHIKRDKDYRSYYLTDKDKLNMDNLTLVKFEYDYKNRRAYYKDLDNDLFVINQPSTEYSEYYANYDKYCEASKSYIAPSSFIFLTKNVIPDENVRIHFLNSLHYFLKTGKTCQTYPIFVDTCGGTGKTALTEIINKIIYDNKNLSEISSLDLTTMRFNGPYVSSKILVINESGDTLSRAQARKVTERLKQVVGNATLMAEFKGRDVQWINAPRFVMQTTNNFEDIYIDSYNSRRQYVVHTSEKRLNEALEESDLEFNNLSELFNDIYSRIPDIIAYLEDISNDFTYEQYCTAPKTQATDELQADSETEVLSDIKSIFKIDGLVDIEALDFMQVEEGDTPKQVLIDFIRNDVLKDGLLREIRLSRVLKEAYENCSRPCIHSVFRYLRHNLPCQNPKAPRHKIFKVKRL